MSFMERIRAHRKRLGKNQKDFGDVLGVSQGAVSTWELGKNVPDLKTIQHIARMLKIPASDLINMEEREEILVRESKNRSDSGRCETIPEPEPNESEHSIPRPVRKKIVETKNDNGYITLPLLSSLASAGGGSMTDCEHSTELIKFHPDWLQSTLQVSPDHLCMIQAIGDSMDPTIRSGEILVVDTRPIDHITDGVYVIRLDGAIMVKRLQRHPKKVIEIISDNPAFKPIRIEPDTPPSEFVVCGRLVWAGRRF